MLHGPIRQTRHLTPEERLRRAISRLLPEQPKKRQAAFFGNNLKTAPESDAWRLLKESGWQIRDMAGCTSYAAFQELGASSLNLYTNPFSLPAVRDLKERLQQDWLYLPQVWSGDAIEGLLQELARRIGVDRKRLWRVLNGERAMRADEFVRLCAELGVGPERFALISVAGRTECFGRQRRGARHDSSG